jgi:hypothetical protein
MLPPRNPEPDPEMLALHRRLLASERRHRWARVRRALFRAGVVGLVGLGAFDLYLVLLNVSPWPPMATLKHLAAFPNCDAARAVGLAPARRGEPGYWPAHDADRDGIACEPRRDDRAGKSSGESSSAPIRGASHAPAADAIGSAKTPGSKTLDSK